ncbi:GntR family transcriptional regulator [Pseudonocardia sp. CA-107938]|uniref:GntR family transcriptional regulator n=1 Tax=Pseudonocardia sp. CA-107938 TaxID=3240021 RepID=UPI003D8AE66D
MARLHDPATRPARSSEDVHRRLRQAIVEGEFLPRERLIELELAEQLGVSRTPIREAMQRLAAEGLIQARARGWAVHEHTADEIRQIYETRIALEGYATRLAAERADDTAIDRVVGLHHECLDEVAAGRLRGSVVELTERFHEAIFSAARNPRIAELILANSDFYFNRRIASAYTDAELVESIGTHQPIVDALTARDADAAEAAGRRHVELALSVVLRTLR